MNALTLIEAVTAYTLSAPFAERLAELRRELRMRAESGEQITDQEVSKMLQLDPPFASLLMAFAAALDRSNEAVGGLAADLRKTKH